MPFQFKQFFINDDQCAMKVGTDGVLLGAWVDVTNVKTILDVGTGSGLIALMLAQRTKSETKIDAVEIEEADARQAAENVAASPWSEKIKVTNSSLQEYIPENKFDLIVSNPPYFSSLVPPGKRKAARHTTSLNSHDLISFAKKFLRPNGRLAVILPTVEGNEFHSTANVQGFFSERRTVVYPTSSKPQERWLFEFGRKITPCTDNSLILLNEGKRTVAYQALTCDFYLNP